MKDTADHFSAQAVDYARFRPHYPDELIDWLAEQTLVHELAWDVGCGNGQASVPLAKHFRHVVASDRSAAQIAAATPHPRIEYRVAPCTESGLPDRSCDVVTVAQALHWFPFPAFFAEVERVLKPGGLLATWTYQLLSLDEPSCNAALMRFYRDVLAPWWPPERGHVDRAYRDIPFPYAVLPAPTFCLTTSWTLDELIGYIGSWTAAQRFQKATGEDPRLALRTRLEPLWPSGQRRCVSWPIVLVACRKPGP